MQKRIVLVVPYGFKNTMQKLYFPEHKYQDETTMSTIPSNQDYRPWSFRTLDDLYKKFPFMKDSDVVELRQQDRKYRL